MVVHSPNQFQVQRTAAAAAAAATAAAGAPADAATLQPDVPPSVRAAADAAANAAAVRSSIEDVAEEVDLLGGGQDFDTWTGEVASGRSIEADVHAAKDEINANVTTRRVHSDSKMQDPTSRLDEDKISVVSDVTPPPPPGTLPSGLNPFTPEWFAQLVGAAASSAASAAASAVASSVRQSSQQPAPAPAGRRLNERKIPDFWEDRPEFWFRIFDAHLAHFSPTEQKSFDALLPLLTPAARAVVHSVIRTPGTSPYSKARGALLRHFGQTPRQLAREFMESRGMGDRLASEFLDHIIGLAPDIKILYEVALLDALPANARVAALQHTDIHAMARAADAVLLENRAAAESSRAVGAVTSAVHSVSLLDADLDCGRTVPPPLTPTVAAVGRDRRPPYKKTDSLCAVHARWGKEAWKCLTPSTCKMSKIICPKPSTPAASGNAKAGGRQ